MKKHLKTVGKTDEWLTPPEIIKALGSFDLDPCAPTIRPWDTAKQHYTEEDNGLIKEWKGRVWLNPPFNRYEKNKWMKKMAEHNNGIMLIPASMETASFKRYVYGRCSGLLFLDHRPKFHLVSGEKAKGNVGCSIVLIAYGTANLNSLKHSNLGPVFTQIR